VNSDGFQLLSVRSFLLHFNDCASDDDSPQGNHDDNKPNDVIALALLASGVVYHLGALAFY
jgi:hypothetical protein